MSTWLDWQRGQAKKWGKVAQNFKEVYAETKDDTPLFTQLCGSEPERTGEVETRFCPDCECYVQAELIRDGDEDYWECLECGCI